MFLRWVATALLAFFFGHFLAKYPAANHGENWTGKEIIVKDDSVEVQSVGPDGAPIEIRVKEIIHTVRSEKDGRVQLDNRGEPGWLDKNDAVLIVNAPLFFTTRIGESAR